MTTLKIKEIEKTNVAVNKLNKTDFRSWLGYLLIVAGFAMGIFVVFFHIIIDSNAIRQLRLLYFGISSIASFLLGAFLGTSDRRNLGTC